MFDTLTTSMQPLFSALLALLVGAASSAAAAVTSSWIWLTPTRVDDQEETRSLRAAFLRTLEKGNRAARSLATALKGNKGLRAQMHRDARYPHLLVVMIKGSHDGLLIKLGQSIGLPRGFPIIWDTAFDTVRFGGFLPKFSNDQDMGTENSELSRLRGNLEIGLKFSGYLSMLLCVGRGASGEYLMLATSKNSACCRSRGGADGLDFVLDAQRIWGRVMSVLSSSFFQEMLDNQYTICAEMLSREDQTHGTPVYHETAIPTCISQPATDSSRFVDYLSMEDRNSFLTRHGIWHPGRIHVPAAQTHQFITALCRGRDFMDLQTMRKICKDLRISAGTVLPMGAFGPGMDAFDLYSQTMGNVLEGLVMFAEDGRILKVKFPGYTWRTMLLRTWLNAPGDVNVAGFVRRWCVTQEGRDHYTQLFNLASTTLLPLQKSGKVARHLVIADEAERRMAGGDPTYAGSYTDVDYLSTMVSGLSVGASGAAAAFEDDGEPVINMVLVLGPIGIGKSTTAATIVNNLKKRGLSAVHIDGDELDLGQERVLDLGQERASYTIWKVIEAIYRGEIPVISSGGGVFAKGWKNNSYILDKMVAKAFGWSVHNVRTTLVVPARATAVFGNVERVKDTVRWRIKQGIWTLPDRKHLEPFAADIAKRSQGNLQFVSSFRVAATHVVEVPVVAQRKYSMYDTTTEEMQLMHLVSPNPTTDDLPAPVANQDRLLAFVPGMAKAGHITLGFHSGQPMALSLSDWTVPTVVTGNIIRGGRGNKAPTCWVPYPVRQDLQLPTTAHVTMNPGPHEPKYMRELTEAWLQARDASMPLKKDHTMVVCTPNVDQTGVVATIGPAFGVLHL